MSPESGAQRVRATQAARAAQDARALETLDTWIVTHFRGARLQPLPDSAALAADTTLPARAAAALPRVEAIRPGRTADTLFALHFDGRAGPPTVRPGATVRLVGPTGVRTEITGRLVAHRAFHAPSTPRPSATPTRVAWSYLVILNRSARGNTGASAYRGWLLAPVENR